MEKATQAKTILTTMPVFISGICLIRCLLRKKETERERLLSFSMEDILSDGH